MADDQSRHQHVNPRAADVEAIISAAGQGTRLGLGPKAFVLLAGRTLLEHAVTTMLSVAARVTVAVPSADLAHAEHLVGSSSDRVDAAHRAGDDPDRGTADQVLCMRQVR